MKRSCPQSVPGPLTTPRTKSCHRTLDESNDKYIIAPADCDFVSIIAGITLPS